MLKNTYILPKEFSVKRLVSYVKTALVGNLALGLIVLPTGTLANASIPEGNLIIPQEKLDIAFNVTPKDTDKIQIPLSFFYISQGFNKFHPAIDFAAKYGNTINPVKEGRIIEAGFSPFGYGNQVLIDHGNGIESLYAHLSKIFVKKGDEVSLDSIIGLVGTTGHATGPHLHLEIHKNGVPINPLSILTSLTAYSSNLLSSK